MSNVTDSVTADDGPPLSEAQHLTLGIYLISSGIISGIFNIIGILIFVRFKSILWNPSAIPELTLTFSDLCVAGLHPFSGSSALANRWVWGMVGCQLYSTAGFLFGTVQLSAVVFIAFDRYVTTCQRMEKYRNVRTYIKIFLAIFFFSTFWAVTPLCGWGSYNIMPTGVSCTIDWMRRDPSYVSYMTAYTSFAYICPFFAGMFFYYKVMVALKSNSHLNINYAPRKYSGVVIFGCLVTTTAAFSGYGLLCFWPMIADPKLIPIGLNVLPPPMAKIAGLVNPLFYIRGNPLHWACVKQMICGKEDPRLSDLASARDKKPKETGNADEVVLLAEKSV